MALDPANSTSKMEQARLLADQREALKQESARLRKAIAGGDLKIVLKQAALLISELRSNALTPKSYYDLFLELSEALAPLESYFVRLIQSGAVTGKDIYDSVQHAGNVLPRLYLLVTAGSAYVRSGQVTAKFVLEDLLEMVKGVQHPQRGLFLRSYCITALKDLLPEGSPEAVANSVTFLCNFLIEMNRLWTRMGTSAGSGPGAKNKKRRERERQELRVLVGTCLTRLAKLDGLTFTQFKDTLLPRLLKEVTECRDKVAQAYLLDILLQVFPVEWHVRCLATLLACVRSLVPDHIAVKAVFRALLGRIQDGVMHAKQEADAGTPGASASSFAVEGLPPPGPAIPTIPSCRVSHAGLPADIDVFGSILETLQAMADDPVGPFRGNAPNPRREGEGGNEGTNGSGVGAEATADLVSGQGDTGGGGGVASPDVSPVRSARPPSGSLGAGSLTPGATRLAALRDQHTALAAQEAVASLLEVYACLAQFALSLYPGHTTYVDDILSGAGRVLHDVLGLGPPPSALLSSLALGVNGRTSNGSALLSTPEPISATASLHVSAAASLLSLLEGAASLTPLTALELMRSQQVLAASNSRARGVGVALDDLAATIAVDLLGSCHDALGFDILSLDHYADVLDTLPHRHQRGVASRLLGAVLSNSSALKDGEGSGRICDPARARRVFAGLAPLIREDDATASQGSVPISPSFMSEQAAMARLVQHLGRIGPGTGAGGEGGVMPSSMAPSEVVQAVEADLPVLAVAVDALSWGGAERVSYTFPALAKAACRLMEALGRAPGGGPPDLSKRVFACLHAVCTGLAVAGHAESGLVLLVESGVQCAGCVVHAQWAYEAFAQAFLLLEEVTSTDSKRAAVCLRRIIAGLASVRFMGSEEYEGLAGRAAGLAARALRKEDAVRLLLAAASLFWRDSIAGGGARVEKPKDVLACLQRALRLADSACPPSPVLFLDILNAYAAFQSGSSSGGKALPGITREAVQRLVEIAEAHVSHFASAGGSRAPGGRAQGVAVSYTPSPLLSTLSSSALIGADEAVVDPREYMERTKTALGLTPYSAKAPVPDVDV